MLQQLPHGNFIGKPFFYRRFNQGQFHLEAGRLAVYGVFHGGQLLFNRSFQRFKGLPDQGLLLRRVGKSCRHGSLNQAELGFQDGGLAAHGSFNSRQFLRHSAGNRRDGLPEQFLRCLVVGEAAGNGRFNQLQFFHQRPVRASYCLDDAVIIRLDGNADVRSYIVARRED